MEKRLYRSESDHLLGGVCGGLAEYLDVDPVFVRLAFILLAFANGIGIIAYLALWVIMPKRSRLESPSQEVFRENVEEMRRRAREMGEEVRGALGRRVPAPESERHTSGRPVLVAVLLILVGLLLFMGNLGLFWWFEFGRLWPLILILAGFALLFMRRS